jgi:Flp pilus assembly protein TadD
VEAYDALYAYYEGRGNGGAASQVLSAWLAADPASVAARLVQVREQVREGRLTAAQGLLQRLFADRPGEPRVLSALRAVYGQPGSRTRNWLVSELQQRHGSSPGDVAVAAQLADLLSDDGRSAEATRVLDATRAAVAGDADLLYQVAHLYTRVGQKATTEQVLREALELEPRHAPAANDLGYSLAEDGRDLGRAEALARLAVKAEPANGSFLDSLGWVLYKRGRFGEARECLERSARQAAEAGDDEGPDPVVLDHLGDTLYRLGDGAAAGRNWDGAARRLTEMPADERDRDDLKQLRLQLERKRKQLEAGQPVSASPVADNPAGPRETSRGAAPAPATNNQ